MAKHNDLKEKLEAGVKEHTVEEPVVEEPVVEEPIDENMLLDSTREEMKSGKIANDLWAKRTEAEQEAGRKLVDRHSARTKKSSHKHKEE